MSTAVEINTLIPDIYLCLMEYKGDQLWKKQWKKLGNKENDKKIVSLMRKGFQYKDIQRAIKEIDE